MSIGIAGPRKIAPSERLRVIADIESLLAANSTVYVGDASGVDQVAVDLVTQQGGDLVLYRQHPEVPERARCAERTARMIRGLHQVAGTLHAWPNRPAPDGLQPCRAWPRGAQGSGTWGAIAMATGLGVPVRLHPLMDFELPDWLKTEQLTLFR